METSNGQHRERERLLNPTPSSAGATTTPIPTGAGRNGALLAPPSSKPSASRDLYASSFRSSHRGSYFRGSFQTSVDDSPRWSSHQDGGYRPRSTRIMEESARQVNHPRHSNAIGGGALGRMASVIPSQLGYFQAYPATSLGGLVPDANVDQLYRMSTTTTHRVGLAHMALEEGEGVHCADTGAHPSCCSSCLHAQPLSSCGCFTSAELHYFFRPRLLFPFSVLMTGNFRHIYVIRSSASLKETFGIDDDGTGSVVSSNIPSKRNHRRSAARHSNFSDATQEVGGASQAMAATVNRPLYINVPMLVVGILLVGFLWAALWMSFGATFAPRGELFRAMTVALSAGMLGSVAAWIWGFPASIGILWLGILYQQVERWLGVDDLNDMSSIPTEFVVPYNPSLYSGDSASQSALSDGFGGRYLMPMKLLCVCLVLLRSSFTLGSGLAHPFALGRIVLLSILPLMVDAVVSGLLANYLFDYGGDLGWIFLHGFVCAPLSSSVMLLGVLYVQSKGIGNDGGPLQLILPANSLDAAFGTWCCTIALSVVLNDVSVSQGLSFAPGTIQFGAASASTQAIQSVCQIVGGLMVGSISAFACSLLTSQLFAIDLPHWYSREGFFETGHLLSNAIIMAVAVAMFFGGFAMQVEGGAALAVVSFGMLLSFLWSRQAVGASSSDQESQVDRRPISVAGNTHGKKAPPQQRGGGSDNGDTFGSPSGVFAEDGGVVPTSKFFDSNMSLPTRNNSEVSNVRATDVTGTPHHIPGHSPHHLGNGAFLQGSNGSSHPTTYGSEALAANDDSNATGPDEIAECAGLWRAGARGTVQDAGKLLYSAYLEGDVLDATEEELQYTISTSSPRYAAALAAERKKRFIGAMATLYTMVVQPCLFSFLGASIHVTDIFGDSNFLWRAAAVWALGTVARMIIAPLSAIGTDFSVRERVVLGLTWIGKATTQASLGSMALHKALIFQETACTSATAAPPSPDNFTTTTMSPLLNTTSTLAPPSPNCEAMGEFVRRARCVELSALVCILFGAPVASLMMRKVATRWVRKDA